MVVRERNSDVRGGEATPERPFTVRHFTVTGKTLSLLLSFSSVEIITGEQAGLFSSASRHAYQGVTLLLSASSTRLRGARDAVSEQLAANARLAKRSEALTAWTGTLTVPLPFGGGLARVNPAVSM